MSEQPAAVTALIRAWRAGSDDAGQELAAVLYRELRRLAARQLRRERRDHTLQPTALVHEAYLRLVDQRHVPWQGRAHFVAVAATMMRRVLIDHARKRRAGKRVDPAGIDPISETIKAPDSVDRVDLLAVDEAIDRLSKENKRQADMIVMRYFGDLGIDDIAEVTGLSAATVKRDLAAAKDRLRALLEPPRP